MKKLLLAGSLIVTASFLNGQVTTGLVAKYSFNNGNANDEAGTTNGTVTAATLTTDRFGNSNKAYNFNGSAYIDCGNNQAIASMTTAYSISAWFKRSTTSSGFEVIAAKWNTTPASEHFFLATNGSNVAWASAGPGNAGTNDPTTINLNTWTHVVFTWSSSGLHQVYINNTLTTSSSLGSHTINVTTPVNFFIGAQSPLSRLFNGSIDDVRIYNRVLSATDVSALYNEPNPATVGISESEPLLAEPMIFPNPAGQTLSIRANKVMPFSIQNELGQTVSTGNLTPENNYAQEIENLKPGVYFLTTEASRKKIIIQ